MEGTRVCNHKKVHSLLTLMHHDSLIVREKKDGPKLPQCWHLKPIRNYFQGSNPPEENSCELHAACGGHGWCLWVAASPCGSKSWWWRRNVVFYSSSSSFLSISILPGTSSMGRRKFSKIIQKTTNHAEHHTLYIVIIFLHFSHDLTCETDFLFFPCVFLFLPYIILLFGNWVFTNHEKSWENFYPIHLIGEKIEGNIGQVLVYI